MEKEPTKGSFVYDEEGKVIFEADVNGKWSIQEYEYIKPDKNPIYKCGIDPYDQNK